MKTFKEYTLDSNSLAEQSIYLPNGAEVVKVEEGDKGLVLIALIDTTTTLSELRAFKICLKDENWSAGTVKYIGSFNSFIGTKYVVELVKE